MRHRCDSTADLCLVYDLLFFLAKSSRCFFSLDPSSREGQRDDRDFDPGSNVFCVLLALCFCFFRVVWPFSCTAGGIFHTAARVHGFHEGRSRGGCYWGRPPTRWLYFPRSFSFLTVIFFRVCIWENEWISSRILIDLLHRGEETILLYMR